jgi:hypothetical protein
MPFSMAMSQAVLSMSVGRSTVTPVSFAGSHWISLILVATLWSFASLLASLYTVVSAMFSALYASRLAAA